MKFGCSNNTWVTATGQYGLPVQVNTTSALYHTFSFGYAGSSNVSAAACSVLIVRSDWNPISGAFSNSQTEPTAEVLVCPWWTASLPKVGSCTSVNLTNQLYTLCTDTSTDGVKIWPTYTFASSSTMNLTNVDLLGFTQCLLTKGLLTSSYWVVGVQAGFRLYSGKGTFAFSDVLLSTSPLPVPAPIPVPVPVPDAVPVPALPSPSCPFSIYNLGVSRC